MAFAQGEKAFFVLQEERFSLTKRRCYCIIFFVLIGMWPSLVGRYVRDVEAAGSNPVIPTKKREYPEGALSF